MQLSSKIPQSEELKHLSYQVLEDKEIEQLFNNQAVHQLMAETNACGFELNKCTYDQKRNAFNLELKGITPEGRTFCGDTINLTAKRIDGTIKILEADVDRSYMYESEMDI